MKSCLLLSLFLAIGCHSATDVGTCPEVTPYAALEVAPYLGRWYEIQRFSFIFEGQQDCVMAIYSDNGDGTVGVHNTARNVDGYFTDAYGTAIVAAPGTLAVSFDGVPDANSTGNYIVLGTDYTSYSSVYFCSQQGSLRTQDAWLLSRKFPIDQVAYDAALQHYVDNGINITLFSPTYQGSDCPYYKP